jgi:hypothetical protein
VLVDLVGGGMVVVRGQKLKDHAPLGCDPEALIVEQFDELID